MLFPVKVNVPLPSCTKLPVPLITPAKVTESLRSKAKVPLSVTFPVMLPVVATVTELQRSSTDRRTAGVGVVAGQRSTCRYPSCTKLPVPLITPAKVTESLRSKARVPLSVTLPVMLPLVPPLPSCSVPALIVVPPV